MEPSIYLPAGIIFFGAGFVQGLTGFGSALVAIPLLSLIIDIKAAVPLCMLSGLIITVYLAIRLRRHLDREKIMPLIIGSLPGILVGVTILKQVEAGVIRTCIGLLLIGYSSYNLLIKPRPLYPAKAWGYLAGFLTGAIGAAFSAGGPPAIIYTTLTDWKKDEIKATLTGFFVSNGVITATAHALTGISNLTTLKLFLATGPFVLAGTMLGARVTDRINRSTYLRMIFLFLIAMGIMMIVGGKTG